MAKKPTAKKKIRLSTILIILLFLLGLGVMLYPTAQDLMFQWKAQRDIAAYNRVIEGTDTDYSELWAAAEAYNNQLFEMGQVVVSSNGVSLDSVSDFLNPTGTGMMGYLEIPAIDIYIPIYQGTEEAALQAGAGYWLGTSLPTGGENTHCVLTAHNGLVKAKLFTDLDKLVIGDTFTLYILDRTLTYEVDQILVVEPNDFTEMQIVEGEDYVTLYTCTPYGVNTHRLLVRGHRIETPEETTTVTQTGSGWNTIWFWLLFAQLLILILILILVLRRNLKTNRGGGRALK